MNFGHLQTLTIHTQGWECPKCGCVYSPSIAKCFTCRPQTITGGTTTGLDHHQIPPYGGGPIHEPSSSYSSPFM